MNRFKDCENMFNCITKSNNIVFGGANMIVTTMMLLDKYRDYANPMDKIKREAEKGSLIRLTRGVYETDANVSPYLLASSICSPSYLSFEFALSYYGLIPERVYAITSASFRLRKTKTVVNPLGRYTFSDITQAAFPFGVTYIKEGDYVVRIATKEKAICDSLSKWPVVHSVKDLRELLFEDKRIDVNEFASCDFSLMEKLASLYHKKNLKLLVKMIRRDYGYERGN